MKLETTSPVLRLREELRATQHAMERLKANPRYDEATLAELQVRRKDLESQLHAAGGIMEARQ